MEPKVEIKANIETIEDVNALVKNPAIIKIYSNGLQCGFTLTEAHIVFKEHNAPLAVVNIPLPMVKLLHVQLGKLISTYEKITNSQIKTLEELNPNKPQPAK